MTHYIQVQPKANKPKRKRKISKVNQSLNSEQNFVPSPQNDLNRSEAQPSRIAEILIKYADRFEGLGKLKDYKVKLHVDPSVPPVAQPSRRIPFHLPKSKELEILEREGIIEKVEDATRWVSPVVVVPKPQAGLGTYSSLYRHENGKSCHYS